jgi:hypothetical protein
MKYLALACATLNIALWLTALVFLGGSPSGAAPFGKTYENVEIRFAPGMGEAQKLADGHCLASGWGPAGSFQVDMLDARPGGAGHAHFATIACRPKLG